MNADVCPECGSRHIGYNQVQGEIHCNSCGLILEESRLEQANYISDAVKKSATAPYLSKAESRGMEGKIYKNIWLLSTRQKNLQFGNSKIDALADRLNLPERVITESKIIFKQAIEKDLAIGRSRLSFVMASVYTACIIHGIPKTPLEVVIYSSVDKKQMLRAYKLIKSNLGLSLEPIDPLDLIPRFASKLKLEASTVTLANEIMINIKQTSIIYGRRPESIVASILYLASQINNEPRTQRQVANAVGVIEVTIRKLSKEITSVTTIFS